MHDAYHAADQSLNSNIVSPNGSGCVRLTSLGSNESPGDLDGISSVSDLRKKALNVKSYHTVNKAFTYIEASLASKCEISIG